MIVLGRKRERERERERGRGEGGEVHKNAKNKKNEKGDFRVRAGLQKKQILKKWKREVSLGITNAVYIRNRPFFRLNVFVDPLIK